MIPSHMARRVVDSSVGKENFRPSETHRVKDPPNNPRVNSIPTAQTMKSPHIQITTEPLERETKPNNGANRKAITTTTTYGNARTLKGVTYVAMRPRSSRDRTIT